MDRHPWLPEHHAPASFLRCDLLSHFFLPPFFFLGPTFADVHLQQLDPILGTFEKDAFVVLAFARTKAHLFVR